MEKARIMVVEDEKLVALSIEKCLKSMGYDVPLTVASGEEAVQKVIEIEPDLVLMDIRLKGVIDGVEAANRIRNTFRIPIVYLTAYSEDQTLERAKVTEPFGYITKPFEERTLQATVEMALYKATMQGQLRRAKEKLETVMECIAEGVLVTCVKGTVEFLNPSARGTLLNGGTLVPGTHLQHLFRVVDAFTHKPAMLPVGKVIMDGQSVQLTDLLLLTPGPGRLPVDVSLAPLRDENHNVCGMVLAFRDVSERLKMRDIVNRELRQAIELQRSLLPTEGPAIPGLDLRWLFHPSTFAAGDLFNAFRVDETHVAVYMIDVAGHGIASAVNSLLFHRFLTPALSPGAKFPLLDADPGSPGDVVQKLEERFCAGAGMPCFSILYGVIDLGTGSVRLARAGQPHPLVQRKNGSVEVVTAQGRAAAREEGRRFTEHQTRMERGDRLFLFSDGLVECTSPDMEQLSGSRLISLLEGFGASSLADAVDSLDREILRWRGREEFDDDVCLAAVQLG